MTKRMKTRITALVLFLALAAASAAASDANTNVETPMGGADRASHPGSQVLDVPSVDSSPLLIDGTPYPQDHAYSCADGNCTDW